MENNFSLKMYLEGYENVVKKANDLVAVDLDGRKKEFTDLRRFKSSGR